MIRRSPYLALAAVALAAACGGSTPPPVLDLGDADGDGILDVHEGEGDSDGDGTPDFLDLDSDDDGWSDAVEAGDDDPLTLPRDSDGDGTPDYLDLDSDGNGLRDSLEGWRQERAPDADDDGILDPHDLDDDGDGVPDVLEMEDGLDLDTDHDDDPDRRDPDSDDDGIPDAIEGQPRYSASLPDRDEDGRPDLRDLDSDGDTIDDGEESGGTNPPRDSDADGIPDFRDRDSDDDGLTDRAELGHSNPYSADSDGDGVRDGVELTLGSDPRDRASIPDQPVLQVSARHTREEAVSLTAHSRRADVVFVVDGAEMSIDHLSPVAGAARALLERVPHSAVGLVTGGEVNLRPWGNYGDALYRIDSPVTTEGEAIARAVERWDDWRNTGGYAVIEAATQALMGRGFDLGCDGTFDPSSDVLPWVAESEDPFGGKAGSLSDAWPVGVGDGNGLGFRRYSAPILVVASRSVFTDPSIPDDRLAAYVTSYGGDPALWQYASQGPGGCPADGSSDELIAELDRRGGQLVVFQAAYVAPGGYEKEFLVPWLAEQIPYRVDLDGDGFADEPPILQRDMSLPETDVDRVIDELVSVVQQAIEARAFEWAELLVVDDPHGLIVGIEPSTFAIDESGIATVDATVTLRGTLPPQPTDQIIPIELVVAAEGKVAVAEERWWVVVPGTGLD